MTLALHEPSVVDEPLTPDAAGAHVHERALRDGPTGRVGLELEAHAVDAAVPGDRPGWERLQQALAGVAALPGRSVVTLEPGGQVELSTPPYDGSAAAVAALRADAAVLRTALRGVGIGLAWLGADPARPPVRVHPGGRYAAMAAAFAATGDGTAGAAMMCSTASLQVNLDAGPRAGWGDRVALAHRLGPVLVAVSACSPALAGRLTEWRSARQRVWGELDSSRCGPLRGGDDPAGEWADYALAAPVLLVRGPDGSAEPVRTRVPFRAWAAGEVPLGHRRPTLADVDYHLTTLFPPVRLRGFLEVRYLDATPSRWWPALTAADAAADACAPLDGAWTRAARDGLADRELHRAAVRCLAAAEAAAPVELRGDVAALAELVSAGRSPGDELLAAVRRQGPLAALAGAADRG